MNLSNENTNPLNIQIVNAFIKDGQGGNPAGVVLNADDLTDTDMLSIAKKVGLSETAFVSASNIAGFKLDFFTPNRRIAHCGHATIATFSYLASLGLVEDGETSKETVDGPRKIILKEGAAFMEQLAPAYRNAKDWEKDGVTLDDVLTSLGLQEGDLAGDVEPFVVNTGNNFLVLGVKDQTILQKLITRPNQITEISDKLDLIGYYIFTTQTNTSDATTRMFAPRYEIAEEAATGMAAGPLACVLYDHLNIKKDTFLIEQGEFMDTPSPSLITVELNIKDGEIQNLMAGGYGKVMQNLKVTL
ncbi:PhzF family phenazine biosynthesis protein [Terasakiella sp. A23]|uniref:PhzF family phenazine biosynthesis protein n=1 Tax=Terasakiella sp. FCG-A23 TaxID=3080561 RepID=UPI0029541F98|nr:PhzF family phenazine biosynthesis protein [Terasakiella sp. A23]MDV7340485.1 PhzF family phenazine biosynthesis protein [Terasakiella sp. A23]